ncbi:hypothetical protein VaNZ11_000673, partial [Volvox africanus]
SEAILRDRHWRGAILAARGTSCILTGGARTFRTFTTTSVAAAMEDARGGHYATSMRGSDGTLVDKPKDELRAAKERIIAQQAREGKMPGAMLMQDRLSGEDKQEKW